jgi:hypothetical protein
MARASVTTKCPCCGNRIEIAQVWEAGGISDKGGFILRCRACEHVFDQCVGRDVYSSRVQSGATLLDRYDAAIEDGASALARFHPKASEPGGT